MRERRDPTGAYATRRLDARPRKAKCIRAASLKATIYTKTALKKHNGGIVMMKKLFAAFLTVTLLFSPIGSMIQDQTTTVEAKSYKSGKKSFNQSNSNTNTNSFFQKKKTNNTNTTTKNNTKKGFFSGGFMRGLMVGGIAGLLFGSLFANMGVLGSILGFIINMIAIVFVIGVIRKIFSYYKNKKRQEANGWRH